MPDLPQFSTFPTKDQHFGRGMERLRMSAVSPSQVTKWAEETRLLIIITTESLESAPDSVLAILRDVARVPLHEDMSVSKLEGVYQNLDEIKKVMETLIPTNREFTVGQIEVEEADNGQTTNYLFPILTDKGIIEIVTNDAWGVGWRLKNHQALETHQQLDRVQNADHSQPPNPNNFYGPRYISPAVLAEVSRKREDFRNLAESIAIYLTKLFKDPDLEINISYLSGGNTFLSEDRFCQLFIKSKKQCASFELGIGESLGVKRVGSHGYRRGNQRRPSELARMAIKLDKRLTSLHNLPHDIW